MKKIFIFSAFVLAACAHENATYDPYDYYTTVEEVLVSYDVNPDDLSCASCQNLPTRISKATAVKNNSGRTTRLRLREAPIPNANAKIEQRNFAFYNQGITKGPQRTSEEQRQVDAVNADPNCRTTMINGIEVKRCMSLIGNKICYFQDQMKQIGFVCEEENIFFLNH